MKQPTRSPAYQALINHLVSLEPRAGYTSALQIRDLTTGELAIVARHEPTVLADTLVDDFRASVVVGLLGDPQFSTTDRATAVGASFIQFLGHQVKKYLLGELQAEIARDEEIRSADESDEYYGRRLGALA